MAAKSVRTHELSADAKRKLRSVSTATLTSQLQKHGLRNTFLAGLYPLRPDLRMVGYAFTLRYIPAREDLADERYDNTKNVQRLAVEAVGPEDVLIVDARGDISAASLGHILGTRITQRGAAGFVTDGALRDTPGFRDLELPTYIRAAARDHLICGPPPSRYAVTYRLCRCGGDAGRCSCRGCRGRGRDPGPYGGGSCPRRL